MASLGGGAGATAIPSIRLWKLHARLRVLQQAGSVRVLDQSF
jgi:hypothetical protein